MVGKCRSRVFKSLRSEYGISNMDLKISCGGCLSVILPEEAGVFGSLIGRVRLG